MDHTRQLDWFDPAQTNAAATIVGCGGIGSFTAFALAKLGVQRLNLLDLDTVEAHNVPNQLFALDQVGQPKVAALAAMIDSIAEPEQVTLHHKRLQDGVPLAPVVVSALDSMQARADLWEQVRYKLAVKLFLDGRLAGQSIVLYAVQPTNPDSVAAYESTLHSDSEGLDAPCTARSVIDVGFAVGSLMTRAVRAHYGGLVVPPVTYLNQETLDLFKGAI